MRYRSCKYIMMSNILAYITHDPFDMGVFHFQKVLNYNYLDVYKT